MKSPMEPSNPRALSYWKNRKLLQLVVGNCTGRLQGLFNKQAAKRAMLMSTISSDPIVATNAYLRPNFFL